MGAPASVANAGTIAAAAIGGGYIAYTQAERLDNEQRAFAALPDAERLRRHEADDLPLGRSNAMMWPVLGGTLLMAGGVAGAAMFEILDAPRTASVFGTLGLAGLAGAGGAIAGYVAWRIAN